MNGGVITNILHAMGMGEKVMNKSVLAHVVSRMGPPEPAATQALAYILQQSPNISRAFVGLLGEAGITFEPGRIESERGHNGPGIPDLTIRDTDGNIRVLVENKFWAGLTEAQPVGYLKTLPDDMDSALLFIVPEQRVDTVWKQLKERCREEGFDLVEERELDRVKRVQVAETRAMLITHWNNALDTLQRAADRHEIERDVLQLRGLAEQEDLEAFLPLRSDEVTNADVARRMINYVELVEPIVNKLVNANGIVNAGRPSHDFHAIGRYLNFLSVSPTVWWLGVELRAWRTNGITPLWLCRWGNIDGPWGEIIKDLSIDVWVDYEQGFIGLPICLKLGVERESVIDYAVEQVQYIAEKLEEAMN